MYVDDITSGGLMSTKDIALATIVSSGVPLARPDPP
jgi:hypothetical protein